MRPDLHPAYAIAKMTCACGNTWETRSTSGDQHLDICSACHPFFTGKQKLMDTQGRIERFNKKYGAKAIVQVDPVAAAAAVIKDAKDAKEAKEATAAKQLAPKGDKKAKAEKPAAKA